jgi:hypothetical protein
VVPPNGHLAGILPLAFTLQGLRERLTDLVAVLKTVISTR